MRAVIDGRARNMARKREADRTSDVIAVGGVNLLDAAVAEGQFPHPVDSAPHSRRQTQTGVGGGRVETVR